MPPIPQDVIRDLKAAHGDDLVLLKVSKVAGADVIIRPPTSPEWQRFKSLASDKKTRSAAVAQLVRDCVVYPETATFAEILARKPALAEAIGDKVAEAGGMMEEIEVEKL